jgi:SAM-dependent methyltransferase
MKGTCRLYDDLAWLWPLWGAPEEYASYCSHVAGLIAGHSLIPARTLLDIGCGGGKNVFNLKRDFEVTGLDLSPGMLELARELNPGCSFERGDMRSFALDRTFDAVLLDDAISYMTTRADLRAAFTSAWRHLAPGGVMVVTPDDTRETFVQNCTTATPASGTRPDGVDVVFVENSYDPDPDDEQYEAVMVYLIRRKGRLCIETDRHILGLFTRAVWREVLTETGFSISEAPHVENGKAYSTFACTKPL